MMNFLILNNSALRKNRKNDRRLNRYFRK